MTEIFVPYVVMRKPKEALRASLFLISLLAVPIVARTTGSDVARATNQAEITVLIYSHGDNDLDGSLVGPGDLNEMVKQATNVNFVVYHDRAAGADQGDAPHLDLPIGYSDGYVFRVAPDASAQDRIPLGEPYTMDPQTLSWFVYHGLTKYPARTTFLVLDDHGGGPNAYFGSRESDTADQDPKSTLGPMSVTDVASALRNAISAAAKDGWTGGANGTRLDAIIHATCVNGSYEVYRTLSPYARYAFGSEELTVGTPSLGSWDVDYSVAPPDPATPDPALTYLQSLVSSGASVYRQQASALGMPSLNAFARAIFDLDRMSTIDTAMTTFVQQVRATNGYSYLTEARSAALGFGSNTGEPDAGLDLYDLGDLLTRIPASAPRELLLARDALYASIESARRYLSTSGPYAGARGLSVYFPPRRSGINLYYQRISDPTGWIRLIRDITPSGKSDIGRVELTNIVKASAWKATLTSQKPLPRSAAGSFIFGEDSGTAGLRMFSSSPATLRTGGPNKAQAVGTFHSFKFGTSHTSVRFTRDLSSLEFDAILVRAGSGTQSTIVVSYPSSFVNGTWKLGTPRYLQAENGSLASIQPSPDDLIAPLVSYAAVVSTRQNESTGQAEAVPPFLGVRKIPQLGVPATAQLSATPIPPTTTSIILANFYTDNYQVEGDLVIEQAEARRQ